MKFVERYNVWVTENGEVFRADKSYQYKTQIHKSGYQFISLNDSQTGKRGSIGVHRLVAMAYLPNPDTKGDVNHKDCDKANNQVSNLEWSTRSENLRHAYKMGRMDKRVKKYRKEARYKLIHEPVAMGYRKNFLAEAFQVPAPIIDRITNRQIYHEHKAQALEVVMRQEEG